MMGCKSLLAGVSGPVYVLVIMFAWASWIDINGLFVELPLLVNSLPEGWNLPSYMAVIIQVANIAPLAYVIAQKLAPHRVKDWPIVYVIVAVGATSCLLLSFFWERTSVIGGELHSTALLVLTACLAMVDCTTSVVFLPYMALFPAQYMTGYYIGEGFSGLIPGLVSLIQGLGSDPECLNQTVVTTNMTTMVNSTEFQIVPVYDPPRFSVEVFFLFLFGMIVVSGLSFTLLHFQPHCKAQRLISGNTYDIQQTEVANGVYHNVVSFHKGEKTNGEVVPQTYESQVITSSKTALSSGAEDEQTQTKRLTRGQLIYVLLVEAWVNAIQNGLLPSTMSYTCLPYGNLAYTLAVRLSTIANPLMCFLALFLPSRSLVIVTLLPLVTTVLAGYHVYLAALSPFPPLKHDTAGVALVVASAVVMAGCVAYTKVTDALILRAHAGKRGLLWCGCMQQVGSLIGAVATFIAINVANVFQSEFACSG